MNYEIKLIDLPEVPRQLAFENPIQYVKECQERRNKEIKEIIKQKILYEEGLYQW